MKIGNHFLGVNWDLIQACGSDFYSITNLAL